MKVIITDPAEDDLETIGDWISRDNPARALSFLVELRASCEGIGATPNAFPFVDHHRDRGIRRRIHGSYLIFYWMKDHAVEILHVLHGAQDYERILFSNDEPE